MIVVSYNIQVGLTWTCYCPLARTHYENWLSHKNAYFACSEWSTMPNDSSPVLSAVINRHLEHVAEKRYEENATCYRVRTWNGCLHRHSAACCFRYSYFVSQWTASVLGVVCVLLCTLASGAYHRLTIPQTVTDMTALWVPPSDPVLPHTKAYMLLFPAV